MIKNNFFKNKYVLITGGGSGIGYQIAKDFLDRGSNVGCSLQQKFIWGKKKYLNMVVKINVKFSRLIFPK